MRVIFFFILGWYFLYPSFSFSNTQINADNLYIDYAKKEFHFLDKVDLTSPDIHLTADELLYNSSHLTATGHIFILQKKNEIELRGEKLEKKSDSITIWTPEGRVFTKDSKKNRAVDSDSILIEVSKKNWDKIHFKGTPNLQDKKIKANAQDEIIYDDKEHTTFFSGLTRFEDEEEHNKIQSSNVYYLENSSKLRFPSSVNITDDQNRFLSASSGEYNIESKFLTLDGNVEYVGSVGTIKSERLRTDKKFNNDGVEKLEYHFEDNVHLDYQSFLGTSKMIVVEPDEGFLQLIGEVHMKGKKNGLLIDSDLATISEKDKKSNFYNNVKFTDDQKVFTSDTAIYDDKTGIFTLMGNAHYEDNASAYDAQIIYLDNKTLSVKFVGMVSGLSSLSNLKGIKINNTTSKKE